MSKETEKRELSSWLDKIQQDSWQLELIISGFVIFLLIGAWQPVLDLEYKVSLLMEVNLKYLLASILYFTLRTGYQALLFCLLVHLVLRGLWIAAIGLRSVSGDIDYERLKYQPRYNEWLKKRIGSFDAYVERLERYCSVLFSLAFLILFCFISLAVYSSFVAVIQLVIVEFFDHERQTQGIGLANNIIGLIYLLLGFIYLIDFFSFGFFKRKRFTARPYYYVYRFMGWMTLARFYRPLYYNLIDQGFGRKLARFLPIFIVGILVAVSLVFIKYPYFPYYAEDGRAWIDHYNYDDSRQQNLVGQTWRTSLKSKYVQNNYVEVFVPYRPVRDNAVIKHKFPELEPARYEGVKLSGAFQLGTRFNRDAVADSLLIALTGIQELYVDDSLIVEIKPRFHFNEVRQQPGLLYMLPTHELEVGEHHVLVKKQRITSDSLYWVGDAGIYFYK